MCFIPDGCTRRGGLEPNASKPQVVLLFSDVTSSLIESEINQVSTLTADVIDALPPGTEYYVFPIQMEPERLQPILHQTITAPKTFGVDEELKKRRRESLNKSITELYQLIKGAKASPVAFGNPDNHSCIIYTLDFANNFFRQFDFSKYDLELIYISDMVEECNRTPLRQPISLASPDISAQIKLAQSADLSLQLSHVRISIIIPVTKETYVIRTRPSVSDLRRFWENIFLHCGFQSQDLQDDKKFYFSSGLPARLQSMNAGQ